MQFWRDLFTWTAKLIIFTSLCLQRRRKAAEDSSWREESFPKGLHHKTQSRAGTKWLRPYILPFFQQRSCQGRFFYRQGKDRSSSGVVCFQPESRSKGWLNQIFQEWTLQAPTTHLGSYGGGQCWRKWVCQCRLEFPWFPLSQWLRYGLKQIPTVWFLESH